MYLINLTSYDFSKYGINGNGNNDNDNNNANGANDNNGANGANGNNGANGANGNNGSNSSNGTNGNNGANGANGNNGANGANNNQQYVPNASSLEIVDLFYDATYCWGTKDEQMEQALQSINGNNVMDVMRTWNLVHSTEKGESFMQAFMWDADSSQKEQYGKQIAAALRDKALQLGIFEDCREDFAVIDNELRSWFYISNDITKNFDNIIKKITEAENTSNGTPYDQSSETNWWNSTTRGMSFYNVA